VRKILAIVVQDIRTFLSNRSNLPSLLLIPAVMTVIIGLVSGGAFNSGAQVRRLDVIDSDRSSASADLLAAIRDADSSLLLCPMDNMIDDACQLGGSSDLTLDASLDRVAASTAVALIEIPRGLGLNLSQRTPTTIYFRSADVFGSSQAAQQAVEAALRRVNGAVSASAVGMKVVSDLGLTAQEVADSGIEQAIYHRAVELWKNPPVDVITTLSGAPVERNFSSSLQNGLGQSVPGMGAMFVLLTVFGGMAALCVERQQGTLQRLAQMPLSRASLLAGKILARFALGLIQFLVVIVIGAALGMDFGSDPLALVLLIIAYTLAITAMSFAVGTRVQNPSQASGLSLLFTLILAPLGGAWWPISITPAFMQAIGRISPVAWLMEGATSLVYEGGHLPDILLPLGVLLGLALTCFLIAVPRFRYQVD
jgi:ABC-type multidrug transport system permease subunit